MHLKHFTYEFNTPYAQKTDKKTEAQLDKNTQLSATESSVPHQVLPPTFPCAALCVAKSTFSTHMAQSVMKITTFLSYTFLMLPQSGCHHPWHHEPWHAVTRKVTVQHTEYTEIIYYFPAFEIEMCHAHRNVPSDLSEISPELCDHPKYYSSSERWKEGKEKPGIFSVELLALHTVFFTGQACCPADAQPVLLIFHFQMEATSWPALGRKPAASLVHPWWPVQLVGSVLHPADHVTHSSDNSILLITSCS